MLKEAVVEAVSAGKFHIYPVSTVDEGLEVLTGQKAGKRRQDGRFEPNSINDRVQRRLLALAERLRDFTRGAKETHENEEGSKAK
jgi:ATP-dependent Lon protease